MCNNSPKQARGSRRRRCLPRARCFLTSPAACSVYFRKLYDTVTPCSRRADRAGTVLAYRALRALGPATDGGRADKKAVVEAMRKTADRLGNTPAVARRNKKQPAKQESKKEPNQPRPQKKTPQKKKKTPPPPQTPQNP